MIIYNLLLGRLHGKAGNNQQLLDLGFEVCQGGAAVGGRGDRGGNFARDFGSKEEKNQKQHTNLGLKVHRFFLKQLAAGHFR